MNPDDLTKFITVASHSKDQPQACFSALESLVKDTVGVKLFTVMEQDIERGVAWRNYSNMPDQYPAMGEKPMMQNSWSAIVDNDQTFVANSIQEVAEVFSDFELIRSLGCESCINIPVFIGGSLRGTLNCLHEAGHYTPARIKLAESLKLPGTIAFLMSANYKNRGQHIG